jgi:hypothetical protein
MKKMEPLYVCPDCLEDFEFVRFEIDPETLEHRGIFRCHCEDETIFPEELALEILDDEDLRYQMRISRMLCVKNALIRHQRRQTRVITPAVELHTRRLQTYLQDFSEKSARQFK